MRGVNSSCRQGVRLACRLTRFRGRDGTQQFLTLGEGLEFDQASGEPKMARASYPVRQRARFDAPTVKAALETYLVTYAGSGGTPPLRRQRRFKKTVYGDTETKLPWTPSRHRVGTMHTR